ncbi:FAD-dependent oxidoreductase [Amycolatopsis rubida]|uniref:FAD-dependent oxidoreductase n=2 Tax=Pseudonocardiaceae TaxID=2070 RepID=A0ABX0C084_9PSEU|nr:FAD-dependent oxidoreductase [Amycolatopsis rubida]NEC61081.1 FAD-dependent oxidoreductase [Amycolatopsis rubida]
MPVPSGIPSPALTPEAVDAAVANANVPTLIATLVQLTGTREWLAERYRPERARGLTESDGGGLPENIQQEVRTAAAVAIREWLNGKPVALPRLAPDEALEILRFTVGEEVPGEYADYIQSEISAMAPADDLDVGPRKTLSGLSVGIIGAGVSGIASAIALMRRGADVVLFERSDDVGGTWHANRYPGCGVDTASHLYQFSYEPGDWSFYYAPQTHLKQYLRQVAEMHEVTSRVHFGSEVVAAEYDDVRSNWTLRVRRSDSGNREHTVDVLISAVGAFGTKSVPPIAGLDKFAGPTYHTADWPADADLEGKRVAVVGTGASAMQLVPAVADSVASMTIFQRSPQWAAPFEAFHQPINEGLRSLLRTVPVFRAWYRARLGWIMNDKIHASLQVDPDWQDEGRSINAVNAGHRRFFSRYMENELGGDADLLAKTLPAYPPFGKRMLLDNGWFRTLTRENVELVVDPIARVVPDGVVTAGGKHIEVDVLILATGFDVVHYLSTVDVRGVGGASLNSVWDGDDCRAYLGMTVPGFPGLFCLYGPNAAPGHGGSYINTVECQLDYIADLLEKMRSAGGVAVDVKPEAYAEYTERVDEAHRRMVWSQPGVTTYYRNARGRVVYANPWRIVDYWHMTRTADLENYEIRKRSVGE